MNHPENPSSKLLTELFRKAAVGDEVAMREYFYCLAAAKRGEADRHLTAVRHWIRTTRGF